MKKSPRRSKLMTLASNQVTRAIERAQLRAHNIAMQSEMRIRPAGMESQSMVGGVAQSVGMAMKTIEGWDDPDAVGDVLEAAVEAMHAIADDGFRWNPEHAELICDALDCATQVLSGMPAEANMKAWLWHQQIEARVRANAVSRETQGDA